MTHTGVHFKGILFFGLFVLVAFVANLTEANLLLVTVLLSLVVVASFEQKVEELLWNFPVRAILLVFIGALVLMVAATAGIYLFCERFLGSMFLRPELSWLVQAGGKTALFYLTISVLEEVFFRGFLQESYLGRFLKGGIGPLSKKNLLASLLFALAHVISYRSIFRLNTFTGGLFYGWLVERTGSLWSAIVAHAMSNLLLWWSRLLFDMNFQ